MISTILGISLEAFVFLHVVLSLVGIMTGLIVLAVMLQNGSLAGWNAFFLISTILTSVTGFMIPAKTILPSHVFGTVSLVVLALALFALYVRKLAGPWRTTYVVTALIALYLNCFVAVVQSFGKFAFLKGQAPTGTEAPFAVAQAIVLILFLIGGFFAVRRFHPQQTRS